MEHELQRLVDARAIEDLMIEYFDRVDALDPFGAAACFAEGATADLMTGKVYEGRDRIGRALARKLTACGASEIAISGSAIVSISIGTTITASCAATSTFSA